MFAQSLLCKASSDVIQGKVKVQLTSPNKTEISLPANTASYTDSELSFTNSGTDTITFDLHIDEWQGYSANYYQVGVRYTEFCYSNGVTTEVITSGGDTKTNVEKKGITLSPGNTLNFIWRRSQNHVSSYDGYMGYRIGTTLSYELYIDINKPTDYKEIKIYDEVGLGTEVSAYTIGRLPDKSRWDGGLLDGVGGLPLEFVEKVVVTKGSSSTMSVGTYNFNTYIIGVAENEQQSFKIGYWYSNYIYPGYSQNPIGMDSAYIKAGLPITIFGQYIPTGSTITVYVYKLNLPS